MTWLCNSAHIADRIFELITGWNDYPVFVENIEATSEPNTNTIEIKIEGKKFLVVVTELDQ